MRKREDSETSETSDPGARSASRHRAASRAAAVRARGVESLRGGRLSDYRRLFGEAARIEDAHRRYWVQRELVAQGLAAVSRAPARLAAQMLHATAAGALDALEDQPAEPLLLNYAGVALYELWSLDAAQSLFGAALRLDPQLLQVEGNLRELEQRRRQSGAAEAQRPASLAELAARARAVADRAQPAKGLTLSLCMIVRDEHDMLPRCLQAIAGAVDEIVIVDTGSRDDTVEIARSFGARVIEREWTGSFADARNVSFDAASGDWIVYLDADEVLIEQDADALRELTGRTWREAFYLSETNYTGELEMGSAVTHNALRVFRNREDYRFRGRLHEQIAGTLPGYLPERIESTSVRIEHYGYLSAVHHSREKSKRNIELLRLQQQDGEETPFLRFNLGSEHVAAGEPQQAVREFERAWQLLEGYPDRDSFQFAPALAKRLTQALRSCGRPREAIQFAQIALPRFPGFTDLVLEQAGAHADLGEAEQAAALCERCLEMGDAPRRYTATVGAGSYLPRLQLADLRLALGDADAACELLEGALAEHPRFIGTVLPFATALIARGDDAAQVSARIERLLGELSPAARFLLGTALYEGGALAAGEQQFREVLRRQPSSGRARVALGEALLAQRRYEEAAQIAGEMGPDDPLAAMSCRTELFALIVSGAQRRTVDAALAKAAEADVPAAELDLLRAWAASSAGEGEHPPEAGGHAPPTGSERLPTLDDEAVPLLSVMLEALLRVHEFKAFEALLALLERTSLPERARRQMLAEMYLRRGFHASAAEEWMAVCRQSPDVPALVGLASVAEREGMTEQAVEFARAALEREPENEAALQVLDRRAASTRS